MKPEAPAPQRGAAGGLDSRPGVRHPLPPCTGSEGLRRNPERESDMYIFITLLLAAMIGAFGAGFAFACRMDPDENRR